METPIFDIYTIIEVNSGVARPPAIFLGEKGKATAAFLQRANELWRTQAVTFFRIEDVEQFQIEVQLEDSLDIFYSTPYRYTWSELPELTLPDGYSIDKPILYECIKTWDQNDDKISVLFLKGEIYQNISDCKEYVWQADTVACLFDAYDESVFYFTADMLAEHFIIHQPSPSGWDKV